MLTHSFQTGSTNLQMRRMLQRKKKITTTTTTTKTPKPQLLPEKILFLACIHKATYLLLHPLEWIVAARNTYCRGTKKKITVELLVHTHSLLKGQLGF